MPTPVIVLISCAGAAAVLFLIWFFLTAAKPVKKEKKTVRLSFGKKEKLLQNPPKTAENATGEYFMYKKLSLKWLKTQWKKWKTPWETPLLFHKCGGKPGGKSG